MYTLNEWIREFSPELKNLDSFPLTGAPTFPWENLGHELAKVFNKSEIIVLPTNIEWRSPKSLLDGFPGPISTLTFAAPPLSGEFYWIMSDESLNLLKTIFLSQSDQPLHCEDKIFNSSFLRFLALETLFHFSHLYPIPHFTPILLPSETLQSTHALCIDISISIEQSGLLSGRLILPKPFQLEWTAYLKKHNALVKNEHLAKHVDLFLHIEAGQTLMNLHQWQNVKPGDFILLDTCTLQKEDLQGRVCLTAFGHPIFLARLKDGKIKISDFPLYQEVTTPMNEQERQKNEKEEDNLEDFEFEDSLDLSKILEETDNTTNENIEDNTSQDETKDFPEELGQENIEEVLTPPPPAQPIPPSQIPISLVVELGRIQITVAKLLELEPGNFLELDIDPKDGVDLVINGKVAGKGELVRLGDAIGVRVLELG